MSWEVHVDWRGETKLVGRLHAAGRGESVSFEYASEWVAVGFSIDPASLPLRAGAHHSPALFGAMQDCGPDRWGRVLVERAVRKKILEAKPYRDIDYVIALDDATRLGALRFRMSEVGPFLSPSEGKLPPLVKLSALMRASEAIQTESESAQDLRFLLGAGSPLGGARPKSAVQLEDGRLGIAKFPKIDETRDIAAGEGLAMRLAARAGIEVAEHAIVPVGKTSVAVIARFDREGARRIPFVSAATMLALGRGEDGSYTAIADAIRAHGRDVERDCHELWRRLVFSLLASNYDDHARNHGFLMREPGKWSLSPAYDINPTPEIDRTRTNKMPISDDLAEASMAGALEVANRFGLRAVEAKAILRKVFDATQKWREVGRSLRIKAATLDAYASAFENEAATEARKLLKG